MSETIQTAIYKLRQEIAVMDAGKLQKKELDFSFLEQQLKSKGYNPQKLQDDRIPTHEFRLFYKKWNNEIKWKEFIQEIVKEDEDVLEHNISINEGFILLIKKKHTKTLYAITGGFGHTEIQSYIDYQFGLNILARLINADEKVIKSAKERNFVGGVLGTVKYFRGEFNLNDNEGFGNYYYELKTKIDKKTLKDIFKFKDEELKREGLCEAKSSFTIRKPITLTRAVEVIDALHLLLQTKATKDLNVIKRLDKSDKALIEKLDNEVNKKLFEIFKGTIGDVNFEICHKYFDKFYEANTFKIIFTHARKKIEEEISECSNFIDIVNLFKEQSVTIANLDEFNSLVESTHVYSFQEDIELTHGNLLDHLCAEIPFNKKNYFLFNQEWYLIKPDFENILNTQCQEFINENSVHHIIKQWQLATKSENEFNSNHIGDSNTLVFDKVTPENIEVCDILKWNKTEVYFIHVKEGFNNEMRNLGRQVHISARRITEDLKSGKVFLSKLYDELKNLNPKTPYFIAAQNQLNSISKKDFIKIFDSKKPVFVVAILDSSKRSSTRNFSDVKKFNSNIAKFACNN